MHSYGRSVITENDNLTHIFLFRLEYYFILPPVFSNVSLSSETL